MSIVIRRVVSDDDVQSVSVLLSRFEAEVTELLLRDYGLVFADLAPGAGLLTELRSVMVPPGFLLLGSVDDQPAGTAGLRALDDGVGEVKRMFVDPALRGRGLARGLLSGLLESAGDFHTLLLESAEWMTEAHALYRSVGFEDCEPYAGREFAGVDGAVEHSHFMRLKLP